LDLLHTMNTDEFLVSIPVQYAEGGVGMENTVTWHPAKTSCSFSVSCNTPLKQSQDLLGTHASSIIIAAS
jgi:hypothetical protein